MGITLAITRKTWHHLRFLSPPEVFCLLTHGNLAHLNGYHSSLMWTHPLVTFCYFIPTPEPPLWSQSLKVHQLPGQSHIPNVQFNTLDCTSNFPLEKKGKPTCLSKFHFGRALSSTAAHELQLLPQIQRGRAETPQNPTAGWEHSCSWAPDVLLLSQTGCKQRRTKRAGLGREFFVGC